MKALATSSFYSPKQNKVGSIARVSISTKSRSQQENADYFFKYVVAAAALGTGCAAYMAVKAPSMTEAEKNAPGCAPEPTDVKPSSTKAAAKATPTGYNDPPPRPDLPTFSMEEVSEHNDLDVGLWYTFRGAVYDLTTFYNGHPGGSPRLLMAAGQDLEPYWEVYRQHFRGHIMDWMEKHRIGNLSPEEAEKASKWDFGDMFETDPIRHPDLLPCTEKPFNGEPRIELLTQDYITPNELHYVRNHLAVPVIDPEEYVLIVKGKGLKKHKFRLQDLMEKFTHHKVTTTLQCCGNRREDLHGERRIFIAPHWVIGAMSTATWEGVKLRDVLAECGVDVDAYTLGTKEDNPNWTHVQFESYDADECGTNYGISIPFDKVMDPFGDTLLAFKMNGKPLPRDHGYPVRALVPGHAGKCSAKWLHKVILSAEPSKTSYQRKSYCHFPNNVDFEGVLSETNPAEMASGKTIQELPVQSFVCNPPQNSVVGMKDGTSLEVKGVAWSGGGKGINRVEISLDGGKTFVPTDLYKPVKERRNHEWAWTQFSKQVTLPEEVQKRLQQGEKVRIDICSKALNTDFNVQPETMAPYWNPRGVAINHWYHVSIQLDPNRPKGTIIRLPDHESIDQEFGNKPSGGEFKLPWGHHGWTIDPAHRTDPRATKAPEAYQK